MPQPSLQDIGIDKWDKINFGLIFIKIVHSRYLSEGFQVIIDKSKDTKCSLKDVQLRFLCPDDLDEVCITY